MSLKKLDVYIIRSFVGPLLICFLAIVGLYVVMDAFDKLEDFLSNGALMLIPLMLEYYFFNVPIFTIQLLPAIILISVCFTLVKMSRANEILAMRATGISTYRILLPLFVAAVALSVAASLVQEVGVPRFARGLEEFNRTVLGDIKKSALDGQIRESNDVYTIYKFWNYNFNENAASRVEIIRINNRRSSSLFCLDDIKDPAGLVVKLRSSRDALSQYIRRRFRPSTRELLRKYDGSSRPSKPLQTALTAELTRLLQGDCLYDEQRFADVPLTEETRSLVGQDQDGVCINRLLLEEAYPNEIAKGRRIKCLIAEGGGKWENGKWVLENVVAPGAGQLPPVRAIIVDPSDPDRLCLGMARWGIFMSEDGGGSWTKTNGGLSDSDRDIRFLAVTPQTQNSQGAMLFAGSVGGVFEFDYGKTKWINIVKEIVMPKLLGMPELKEKKPHLKDKSATKSVKDIFRKVYQLLGENGPALEKIAHIFDIPKGVSQDIDAYSDFIDIRNVRTILVDNEPGADAPDRKTRLYIGTDTGIAELERHKGVWQRPRAYRSRPRRLAGKAVRALATDAEGRLCAATADGVYRRDDPSEKREFFGNIGLQQLDVKALNVRENHLFAAASKGILRREITPSQADRSASGQWRPVSDGLTNLDVQTLAKDDAGILYAGTASGVFKSENNGDNWTPVLGLEHKCVKSLAVAAQDPHGPRILYAGTLRKGVFKFVEEKAQGHAERNEASPKGLDNAPRWKPMNSDDLQQKLPKLYFKTSLRPEKLEADEVDPGLKSFHELRALCQSEPDKPSYRVMMHSRASYPLTGLVLLLLGVPFIIGFEKLSRSRFLGVAACAALCGAFYALSFFCASLGDNGAINPALAAWIPVILSGAVGLFLLDSINI